VPPQNQQGEAMRFPIYELLNLQETLDLLDRIQKSPRMAKDKFKPIRLKSNASVRRQPKMWWTL
jgi:hypothetical protein